MFKNFKKYVSATLATAVAFTSVFSTSAIGAISAIDSEGISTAFDSTVPDGATYVKAVPEKTKVNAGDQFYVDFKIENNPGLYGYTFAVKYTEGVVKPVTGVITELNKAIEVKYENDEGENKPAVSSKKMNDAVAKAANGQYVFADMINSGAGVGKGDGVLFRAMFEAVADGDATIQVDAYDKAFLSNSESKNIVAYSESADVKVGDSSVKPAAQIIKQIDADGISSDYTGDVAASDVVVEAVPTNAKPAVGEEFYVDFKITNNPGLYGYTFAVKYDENVVEPATGVVTELNKAIEVKYENDEGENKPAVSSKKMNDAVAKAANGQYVFADMINSGAGVGKGDGVLFRAVFKAKAEGSCNIYVDAYDKAFLSNSESKNIVSITKGGVVTIGGGEETTTEATSEATTSKEETTTSEATTSKEETTTEKATETTTSKVTTTEATTEDTTTETTTRRSSGGGGGSAKRENYTTTTKATTTTEATTEATSEKDTEATTSSKPSNNENNNTANTNNGISFVTNTGVKVNIPKAVSANAIDFADVKALTPWAASAVSKLSSAGIINGLNENAFNPKGNTTRGDFMVIIAKLLGLEGTPSSNFSDVNPNKYYYNAIGLTKQIGIASGVSADKFDPEAPITREQVMAITARVLNLVGALETADLSVLDKFVDKANISNYAKASVASLVAMGIVSGDTANKINPTANITRAETAVIMNGVYSIVTEKAEKEAQATTEATTETTTEDEEASSEGTEEGTADNSEVVSDYKDVVEYYTALMSYVAGDDDELKLVNDKFEEYQDEYTQVYEQIADFSDKYEDAKEVDADELASDIKVLLSNLKDFAEEVDFEVTADDSKKVIKENKDTIDELVAAIEKALA